MTKEESEVIFNEIESSYRSGIANIKRACELREEAIPQKEGGVCSEQIILTGLLADFLSPENFKEQMEYLTEGVGMLFKSMPEDNAKAE